MTVDCLTEIPNFLNRKLWTPEDWAHHWAEHSEAA